MCIIAVLSLTISKGDNWLINNRDRINFWADWWLLYGQMLTISLAANVDSFIAYLANRRRLIRRYASPGRVVGWPRHIWKRDRATIANWSEEEEEEKVHIEISGTQLQIYIW